LPERPGVPEALEKMASDPERFQSPGRLRGLAAISLGISGYKRAGDILLDVAQQPDMNDFVAWCAVDALAEFPHPDVRACVYDLLMEYRAPDFKDKPARYRARLMYLLGFLNAEISTRETGALASETSQHILQDALQDPDAVVRGFAISAWVRLNYKDALEQVQKVIDTDDKPLVLRKAAEALGQIGTRDSIALLEASSVCRW